MSELGHPGAAAGGYAKVSYKGEDAAQAAGEGTAVAAHSTPPPLTPRRIVIPEQAGIYPTVPAPRTAATCALAPPIAYNARRNDDRHPR